MSGGKIGGTGWEAVRIGIAVYIVSVAFVYDPALLAKGTSLEISGAFATAPSAQYWWLQGSVGLALLDSLGGAGYWHGLAD